MPGSHRPDFRWPDGSTVLSKQKEEEEAGNAPQAWGFPEGLFWPEELGVRRIEGKAGECIVFSEKLKHATCPWTGKGQRRTVFMKYSPFGMHHGDRGYDIRDIGLTAAEAQRVAFPERWVEAGASAKAARAYDQRHGPDEWPTEPVAGAAKL